MLHRFHHPCSSKAYIRHSYSQKKKKPSEKSLDFRELQTSSQNVEQGTQVLFGMSIRRRQAASSSQASVSSCHLPPADTGPAPSLRSAPREGREGGNSAPLHAAAHALPPPQPGAPRAPKDTGTHRSSTPAHGHVSASRAGRSGR